jgi:transcription antitermination factor NusG
VSNALDDLSIESYLPLVKTIRKWKDRKKIIFQPLFTSYIFVNLKSSLDSYKALTVNGACAYIRFGKEYAKVSDLEINKIKLLLNADDVSGIETNTALPKVGETKKINYGALTGLECVVLKVNNINKIIVRINSLQQNIIATLPNYYFSEEILKVS